MSLFNFKKTAIGIDIFDQAIEVVLLEKNGNRISLLKKCRTTLLPGFIVHGKVSDRKLLANTLIALLTKNNILFTKYDAVVFGLPDSQSYVYSFSTNKLQEDDYTDLVLSELTKIVPIPVDNLISGYTLISKDKIIKDELKIISVGAEHSVVSEWQSFFSDLGIENIFIAPEKTTTEIGSYFKASIGILTPSKTIPSKILEKEYTEAIGLAISYLDQKNYSVPFFPKSIYKPIIQKKVSNNQVLIDEPEPESEEIDMPITDTDEDKKIRKQKIILITILIFGLIAIGLSFWYQHKQEEKRLAEIASKQTKFSVIQSFNVDIPIAIDTAEVNIDRSIGRLFIDTFTMQADTDEATAFSKIKASQSLSNGEKLWNIPLSVESGIDTSASKNTLSKKYVIIWIIYNDKEVNIIATNKASNAFANTGIKFAISNIEKINIRPSDNKSIYLLTTSISIALEKNIDSVILQ